jgi:hypothetical protein
MQERYKIISFFVTYALVGVMTELFNKQICLKFAHKTHGDEPFPCQPPATCTQALQNRWTTHTGTTNCYCFWHNSTLWVRTSITRFLHHTHPTLTVGLLWTSDQPVAETSTWQHTTHTSDIHAPGGTRIRNLSRRAAADYALDPEVTATGKRLLYRPKYDMATSEIPK